MSNSTSFACIAGKGSLKSHKGKAKFIKEFLIFSTGFFYRYLIISIPIDPTTIAVVVASAGMIFPAINFT